MTVSVLRVANGDKGVWGFGEVRSGSSYRNKQRLLVLPSIQGLVGHSGWPSRDIGLDILHHVECGLRADLKMMKLC